MLEDRLVRARVTAGGVNHPVPGGMLETAENLRREYAIPRAEQDELALRSHQRAVAAQRERRVRRGDRAGQVPVEGRHVIDRDEHPARGHHARERSRRLRAGDGAAPTPRRRSPPATPAGRTTAPRSASSRTPTARRRARACARSPGWSPGPWRACRRRRWASAPSRPTARALAARGPDAGRHRPDRAQRGVRRAGARGAARVGSAPTASSASTSTARGSRSATRSAPPARGSSRRCCASCDRRGGALRPRDDVHRRGQGLAAVFESRRLRPATRGGRGTL